MEDITHIDPLFIVSNLKKAISYYVDKLGFEVRHIGPPDLDFFAIVGRNRVNIMIKEIAPGINATPNHTRHEWARWDAFIYAPDPDKLYDEFLSRDAKFTQPLKNDTDDLRGFEVQDTDGYILFFGRPIHDLPKMTL